VHCSHYKNDRKRCNPRKVGSTHGIRRIKDYDSFPLGNYIKKKINLGMIDT